MTLTKSFRSHFSTILIFTAIGAMTFSCSKQDLDKSDDAEPNYTSLWNNVFADRCGSCHGVESNSNTAGGPDLRTKTSFYAALVGKKGSNYDSWDTLQTTRADCLDYYFVNSGDAASSLLVAILDSTVKPCTVKSHLSAPQNISISSTSLASLKTWINNGATQ